EQREHRLVQWPLQVVPFFHGSQPTNIRPFVCFSTPLVLYSPSTIRRTGGRLMAEQAAHDAPQAAPDPSAILKTMLQPWHDAVANPAAAQAAVLPRLLAIYAQTRYGREHGAAQVETVADYRRAF